MTENSLTEDYWQQIQRADAQSRACQFTWKQDVEEHREPYFSEDPETALAQQLELATANAQKLGMTPDQTQIHLQKTRELVELIAEGFSQTRLLKVLHDGESTRCDALQTDGTYFSIDFFDGLNCVSLFEFYTDNQEDKILPGVPPGGGFLTRDQNDKLTGSAPRAGDYLFFVDGRITQIFSPDNSVLRDFSAHYLELEKVESNDPRSPILRLLISKKSLRPYRLDYLSPSDGKVRLCYEVESYRDYPGAHQFPCQISVKFYDQGNHIMTSENHTLIEAAFNDAADLTELRVPPGTTLSDCRFGKQRGTDYTIGPEGTLPTDEKVWALLEEYGIVESPMNKD